jgi:predicted RNA-binding protein with PUA-like domain
VSVAIAPVEALSRSVPLATMKADAALAGMAMLRQSRLSVSPVTEDEWATVLALARA